MTAKMRFVSPILAACLLMLNCAGAVLEQAPSVPVFSPTFEAVTGPGYLKAISSNACVGNNNCIDNSEVWITNLSMAQSSGQVSLTFSIAGGSTGLAYDVFATTALANPPGAASWTWMGQGYSDVTYSIPHLSQGPVYLLLGTPLDSDGDGLTDAYELLVSHSDPDVTNSIDSSMSDGWAVLWNIDPFAIYDQQNFPTAPQTRLDYWRFNTNTYQSESGLLPIKAEDVSLVPSWSGTALNLSSYFNWLSYPITGPDGPSFNPTNGTIRFWFMPYYSSGTDNGSGFYGTFFNFGTGNDTWTFNMQLNETQLQFGTVGSPTCPLFSPQYSQLQLQSNLWYQFTLTYSPSNVAIYTNGTLLQTSYLAPTINSDSLYNLGNGIVYTASAASDAGGFCFGNYNYADGFAPMNGLADELEIFNYPMTPQAVAAGYPGFGGNPTNMLDTYYVGRSDMLQSYVDGVFPPVGDKAAPCRLGYWRFDNDNLMAEQGQLPLSYDDVSLVPSWSGTALNIASDPGSQVTYWDVFSNGWANINCRQGSLRFWFKPNWSGGPPSSAPFIYLGNPNPAASRWALSINPGGEITFSTASNNVATTLLTSSPLPFDPGHWMQIVLNYGPNGTALYTNGALAATGGPVTDWPNLADRNLGMVIGNDTAYTNSINGQFDEIETFNYQLVPSNIVSNFQIVQSVDSDLDGIPDLLEDIVLPVARPFLGSPVVITGTVEAEQFDMGGPGIGYHNMARNPSSSYRPTRMFITNCDDLGLGYCLDQTRAGDWAQYTINVLVAQTYTIEARVEGIGTNGVFECEFTNSSGFYTNTGPLTITSTNWTNVASVVYLPAGTNVMSLHCLTNGSDANHVGRFNYISVYPWWQVGFASTRTNTITAAQLSTNNDFLDASNNAAIIQSNVNAVGALGGGTILLPEGTYYVSQANPNETNSAFANSAVLITVNNIQIAGAGKTNTILIGYNRATTVLAEESTPQNNIPCTNFVLRDLTVEAQPHLAVVNVTNTAYEMGDLSRQVSFYTGWLTVFSGSSTNQPACNILITNCQFLYGTFPIGLVFYVQNCLITHCDFNIFGGTNVFTGAVNNSPTNTPNTIGYFGSVGIFCSEGPDANVNVIENNYNGNTNLLLSTINLVTNSSEIVAPDGFVYFQSGGNYFIARNTILNYALEGVQLVGGPCAVTGNTYDTTISQLACCALAGYSSAYAGASGTSAVNYSICFIGNQVNGGRFGESPQGTGSTPLNSLNFSGNKLALYPPLPVSDYPGAAVEVQNCASLSVFGNTLVSGGQGILFDPLNGSAVIMNNNFANASYRGIGLEGFGYGGSAQHVVLLNNIIGQGSTFHVQLSASNSFGWFLYQNEYLNSSGDAVSPFMNPISSAVHLSTK